MSSLEVLLFHSSALLGMCILLACAIASTSILYFCRPTKGPGYWASCCWLLLLSYVSFLFDLLDDQLTFTWFTTVVLVAAQAMMMLGIFRFLGRRLPTLLMPVSVVAQAVVEYSRTNLGLTQSFADAAYCAIIVGLAAVVGNILLRDQATGEVRSIRVFIFASLTAYGLAHLTRMLVALSGTAPQLFPEDSILLLSFFTGLPFLIIALVALTAMSLHGILAQSRLHEANAQAHLRRFERLMRISSAATLLIRDYRIEDSNPKCGELFGCERETLHGAAFETLFKQQSDDTPIVPGQPFHRMALRADQTMFQAEVVLLWLEEGLCLAEVRDVSEQKRVEAHLARLTGSDPLTGALNRAAFSARFEILRFELKVTTLVLLDIDHFKRINDLFGNATGDDVLIAFVRLCQAQIGANDVFARIGGEEFVVLLPGTSLAGAHFFLQRLADAVTGTKMSRLPEGLTLCFSAGLSECPPGASFDAVLQQAAQALSRAKAKGRGQVEAYSPVLRAKD